MDLLIYTHKSTERVRYTFDLIFTNLLGLDYKLITDQEEFRSFAGAKFAYTKDPVADSVFFYAVDLLFEKRIGQVGIAIREHEGVPVFFESRPYSALPYDPFAAAFYMVSRYEEYLPYRQDAHHRFPPEESIAYRYHFMDKPVVNLWAQQVGKVLKKNFPAIPLKKSDYRFTPTYDIDMPWAYLNRGPFRTIGGYGKAMLQFNFKDIWDRTRTLVRSRKDPFFTFDYLRELQEKYDLDPVYFFIVGDYDTYDKNPNIEESDFRDLIMDVADNARVGWHPSYASHYNRKKLVTEKKRLEDVLKRPVTKSRQHYLMLELPRTYQNLIDLDVTDDYTMGYTSQLGFRAGICSPFYFYNLHLELKSKLRIHPFAIMDATMQYYQDLPPEAVFERVKPIIDEVKAAGGHLMTLWHNNSFSEEKEWTGWRKPYEEMIEYAKT